MECSTLGSLCPEGREHTLHVQQLADLVKCCIQSPGHCAGGSRPDPFGGKGRRSPVEKYQGRLDRFPVTIWWLALVRHRVPRGRETFGGKHQGRRVPGLLYVTQPDTCHVTPGFYVIRGTVRMTEPTPHLPEMSVLSGPQSPRHAVKVKRVPARGCGESSTR